MSIMHFIIIFAINFWNIYLNNEKSVKLLPSPWMQKLIEKNHQLQILLVEITRIVASAKELSNKIEEILSLSGKYTGVSRVYIFEDNQERTITSNTYEWCNTGIDTQKENLQDFHYEWAPSWKQILDKNGIIVAKDIRSLPDDIYEALAPQQIKSILILPILVQQSPIGFLGFDECSGNRDWTREEINLLQTVSNILAGAFELERARLDLIEKEKKLLLALDGVNQGFWEYDDEKKEFTFDKLWSEKFGREQTVFSIYDIPAYVHPDDVEKIHQVFSSLPNEIDGFIEGEYRLLTEDGNYIWVMGRGRVFYNPTREKICCMGTVTDISSRKVAEEKLEKSEKNFRRFFDTYKGYVFVLDEKGKITTANSFVQKQLGYRLSELKEKTIFDLYHASSKEALKEKFNLVLNGEPCSCSFPIVDLENRQIPVETQIFSGVWDDKEVLFCVSRDITDVILTEKKFRQTFRLNPTLMTFTTYEEGIIVDVNNLFLEKSGFQREEIIGKKTTEIMLISPSTRSEILSSLKQNDGVQNLEIQFRFKDGPRFGLYNGSLIEMGGKKFLLSSVHDITRKKKNEEELKYYRNELEKMVNERTLELEKNQKYYQALIDCQEDLICRWLPDSTLSFVNTAYCHFFGRMENELIGKKWTDFLDREEQLIVEAKVAQLIQKGETIEYERKTKNGNGEYSWIHWIYIPIMGPDRNLIEIQAAGRDITERKMFEEKLQNAKEAAEQSDHLKTAFLQTISHELRTPLNAIMGFSELIDEDEPIGEIMEYRDYILRNGANLLAIIEDMLEFSSMEAGQMPIYIDRIDLMDAMHSIKQQFADFGKHKGKEDIKLKLQMPDGIKELFWHTDLRRLKQIFKKLIDNAYAFTNEGAIEFGFLQKESEILFFVKDTGAGISPEHQKLIFENFRQLDDSLTRKHGGIGMGLALSRKVIEIMGGKIWVESEVGKGSDFFFTLPVNEPIQIIQQKQKSNKP